MTEAIGEIVIEQEDSYFGEEGRWSVRRDGRRLLYPLADRNGRPMTDSEALQQLPRFCSSGIVPTYSEEMAKGIKVGFDLAFRDIAEKLGIV